MALTRAAGPLPRPGLSLSAVSGHTPMKVTVSVMSARPVRSLGTPSFSNPTEMPQ